MNQVYKKDSDTQVLGLSCPGTLLSFCFCAPSGHLVLAAPNLPLFTLLGTSFSAPPAGVADPLPGFHHEADTVWNFTVFAWMASLPGWQWVGEKRRMGEHFSHWFVSTMHPARYYRIQWSSVITWHDAIGYTGPLLSPGTVL